MARAEKFTIDLNVNGKNVIAQASTSSKELAVNLLAEVEGNKLHKTLLNTNQVTRSFQDLFQSLQRLIGALHFYPPIREDMVVLGSGQWVFDKSLEFGTKTTLAIRAVLCFSWLKTIHE